LARLAPDQQPEQPQGYGESTGQRPERRVRAGHLCGQVEGPQRAVDPGAGGSEGARQEVGDVGGGERHGDRARSVAEPVNAAVLDAPAVGVTFVTASSGTHSSV
jgi:hypothetical protein